MCNTQHVSYIKCHTELPKLYTLKYCKEKWIYYQQNAVQCSKLLFIIGKKDIQYLLLLNIKELLKHLQDCIVGLATECNNNKNNAVIC